MISRIRIQNFRSLIDVDVNLEPLTVLIGRSGTGKSNFVGAIRALREMVTQQSVGEGNNYPLGRQPGAHAFDVELSATRQSPNYSYRLSFGPNVRIRETLTVGGRALFSQRDNKWETPPNVTPAPEPGRVVLGSLTGLRDATIAYNLLNRGIGCYDFPGNVLQQKGEQASPSGYRDDGRNPLAVVNSLHDDINRLSDWSALTDTMASLNPAVRSIDLRAGS